MRISRINLNAAVLVWQQKAGGRAAVKRVEARPSDSDWRDMNNVWGASWELANAPQPPLDLRVSDDIGNTVIISLPCTFFELYPEAWK